jgi:hypothetical protein
MPRRHGSNLRGGAPDQGRVHSHTAQVLRDLGRDRYIFHGLLRRVLKVQRRLHP